MKKIISFFIVILITFNLSGCGLFVLAGSQTKQAIKNTYQTYVPEISTSVEEIQTADATKVVVRITSKFYFDRYVFSLVSDEYPDWIYESKFRVSSDGSELPITFDVINKTPWIVLPVKSNQCARFGFPREGLVFFRLEGNKWVDTPYQNAPIGLQVSLLRNRAEYKHGLGMDKANCAYGAMRWFDGFVCYLDAKGAVYASVETTQPIEENYGRKITPLIRKYLDASYYEKIYRSKYINKDGSGKTIKEIAEANLALANISNTESCYYLNPPVDPDERRSLLEYVKTPQISIQSTLVKIIDEEVVISDAQKQQYYAYPASLGNCSQIIKQNYIARIASENQAEFLDVAGVPNGTFKSPGTAVRVELNKIDGTRSIYLPIKGFSAARINGMNCPENRIFINYGGGLKEYVVLEYDQNARLLRKWQIAFPPELKSWHRLAEMSVSNDKIKMELVDIEETGYIKGKGILTKVTKQYFLEANFAHLK